MNKCINIHDKYSPEYIPKYLSNGIIWGNVYEFEYGEDIIDPFYIENAVGMTKEEIEAHIIMEKLIGGI